MLVKGVETGPGVIDRDFRGEVKVLLINRGGEQYEAEVGDRVAQMVINRIYSEGRYHLRTYNFSWGEVIRELMLT